MNGGRGMAGVEFTPRYVAVAGAERGAAADPVPVALTCTADAEILPAPHPGEDTPQ